MTYPTIMPALTLDFQNSQQLDPRVTFSRSSSATYINSAGQVASAAEHEARFDHDGNGECLGLLIEESRTNLLTYSEQFDNANWTKTRVTITPNSAVALDGTVSASKLVRGIDQNTNVIFQSVSLPQATYTFSVFAKKVEYNFCTLNLPATQGWDSDRWISVNLTDGTYTLSGSAPTSTSVEAYANGWYRISITHAASATVNRAGYIAARSSSGYGSLPGDGTSGIYIWGAQIETSFPTSYIPTAASTVTRSPDLAQVTTADIYGDEFTIINKPFGVSSGSDTLHLQGYPHVERAVVYNENLSQQQINTVTGVDDFWQWRILGSSFALPNFVTDGQVTVDWGDGTVETMTTSEHTFTDGGGYHEVGFRLDSGTYFRPYINNNASHDTKLVAVGPAPESMTLAGERAFMGCTNLEVLDGTIDATGLTSINSAWSSCSSLTSFPFIDTSSVTVFGSAWYGCNSLTSFPLLDTSSGTSFNYSWQGCNSLTSFPLIDTSSGTSFNVSWRSCSSLTSFPLINTASGTNFGAAWHSCSSLTSFPALDTSSGTSFQRAWYNCSSLTSFPLINTAAGTDFLQAWRLSSSLTDFPLINTAAGTNFNAAWRACTSLTNFPANFFDSWTGTPAANCFLNTWDGCSALTATSVENILNSIDTSGQSAPASGVDITIDYNAGTGTPNITTAVTNLKSRGWTITLNGVLQ